MVRAAALASLLLLAAAHAASGRGTPAATLELHAWSAGPGTGYSWARGTLHFRGKKYRFRVNGLGTTYLDTRTPAAGDVYGLKRPRDLDGTYTETEVDAALAATGASGAMKNERGVLIALRSPVEGLVFDISLIGVSIELEPVPRRAR